MSLFKIFRRRNVEASPAVDWSTRPQLEYRTADARVAVEFRDGSAYVDERRLTYVTRESWSALKRWDHALPESVPLPVLDFDWQAVGLGQIRSQTRALAAEFVANGVWVDERRLMPAHTIIRCNVSVVDTAEREA